MGVKITVDGHEVTALEVIHSPADYDWNNRKSISILLDMPIEEARNLFKGNMTWSETIKLASPEFNAESEPIYTEVDRSSYSVVGDLIDHRDGTVTVKMGEPTEYEQIIKKAVEEMLNK